ncbi:MAG: hypothetical protein ACRD6W_08830, partial [Nitrososphaerales archaeon]
LNSDRIELIEEANPPRVDLETLPSNDPAVGHLWSRLTAARHGPMMGMRPASVEVTIETLVAAGALAPDDPAIDEVKAVMAAFTGQVSANLPQPWASLLSGRGSRGGPSGMVALGAVTPPIDGTTICVEALVSSPESFEVHVVVSPDVQMGFGPMDTAITAPRITWWAEDDRQNHYLGGMGSWGGGEDHGQGSILFWPALDPKAKELRLLPTGPSHRAVISVLLPEWKAP